MAYSKIKNFKRMVTVGEEEVNRTVYFDKKGDRYIRHHNEKWLLHPRKDEVLHPVTSNTVSALLEKENFVHGRMYHLDKLPQQERYLTKMSLNAMETFYEREKDFLDSYYSVDSYHLNDFINHAKNTIYGNEE
jgi:hypothetical protein